MNSKSATPAKFNTISGSTLDAQEVEKFNAHAGLWWDEQGEYKPLHEANKLRAPFIRDQILAERGGSTLAGVHILDVGCGGGILTEPLAKLGAHVTGVDPAGELIDMAQWHASLDPKVQRNTRYVKSLVEDLDPQQQYDAVTSVSTIEHVADPEAFVQACCRLVKPGGSIFLVTHNRTFTSWWKAIVAAEYVLGLVPRGTHQWSKFISPEEISAMLANHGFETRKVRGMALHPFKSTWSWTYDLRVTFALHAVRTQ